jgi:predicted nucleotidyltransferase
MPSTVQKLTEKGLISPPKFLPANVHYEVIMGSFAYGVSSDTSDRDLYGFCIPPKEVIFPHLAGHIFGFGRQRKEFGQWSQHHIQDGDVQYDATIYNIVRFFSLCMENNPNMVDALFVPENCVIHCTVIGDMLREKRRMFLHRGCWHKFKGYAHSQMKKMRTKTPEQGSKRYEDVQKHGYDSKFGYHIVRLLDEVEQILTLGDLNLQRAKEILKEIRRGEWTFEQIEQYFAERENSLQRAYEESSLPYGPREGEIKELLFQCLEHHYGNLDACIHIPGRAEAALQRIVEIAQAAIPS